MHHVGYSLLNMGTQTEDAFWGDTIGECSTIPDPLMLPNGDAVHCPSLYGDYGKWKLVRRWLEDNQPSRWHSIIETKVTVKDKDILVTRVYENYPSMVPVSVTNAQLRLALHRMGRSQKFDLLSDEEAIMWEYANEFRADGRMVKVLKYHMGWTQDEIDLLLRTAADIDV